MVAIRVGEFGLELRQLRYFVRVVELGSMGRAAIDLGVVQSALSQQISRLEGELSARLLQRTQRGVVPTDAGAAFFREAKLTLRHADQAVRSAQQARLSGTVSVGLAPTTAAILGLPLMQAMQAHYPAVRLHMVESMSGHLAAMLVSRELDLAVLFDASMQAQKDSGGNRLLQVQPLLLEDIFLVCSRNDARRTWPAAMSLAELGDEPLILPTGLHGLRSTLNAAFARAGLVPRVALEVDSLSMVMAAVDAGLGVSLQPRAALGRYSDAEQRFTLVRIADAQLQRVNLLCSLSEDELSSAALAARLVLRNTVQSLVDSGIWSGSKLWHHDS